jgi:nicotinate-nucleotide--dimethylbenzimidazole phosphoribosyltransferase
VTRQMMANFIAGGAAINQVCKVVDADLRVYEMALDQPTHDFTVEPAMSEAECVRAMAYGMMTVEPGVDLLCLGDMGIGNTTAAAAICCALFGGAAKDWTGPGTGLAGAALANKCKVVAAGVERHSASRGDPLAVLQCLGGHELAAIAGAILAARLARVPVLLDGYVVTASAAVLQALDPGLLDHCMVGHRSTEPGHSRLCTSLGKRPLLDLNMRLGEGSGAALALGIVRAAVACHAGMATFAEAGVSGKSG